MTNKEKRPAASAARPGLNEPNDPAIRPSTGLEDVSEDTARRLLCRIRIRKLTDLMVVPWVSEADVWELESKRAVFQTELANLKAF